MSDLIELLRIEGVDLSNEFKKASIKGRGTPQEIADFRELYFHSFLSKYFPFPYRIAKGGILDTYGNKSASIDCILCNPAHPYTVDNSGKFTVLLADGVDCAIEIKPDISNKEELIRGLKQIISLKRLLRSKSSIVVTSKATQDEIEYSKRIPSFIFSLKAKANIDDTVSEIIDYYRAEKVPLEEQIDYVVINGSGIIINHKISQTNMRYVPDGVKKYGYFYEQWDDLTLAAFLLYINLSYGAIPMITDSILERYLYNIPRVKASRYDFEGFWE
ncbi:DUF6602 domain-containing protein [Paenibacillus luteus]|uniref:DUF6602 domain-containing protein n=1 Tax=Paenibacillus luteus TaxID=2545753 RepID=UPI0011417834|nr:DUF6602 domain-containing protein [Paenibacillus luteus]